MARICSATLLQHKGDISVIAENGVVREIPTSYVLPWYEGLLLIEQMERSKGTPDRLHAHWCGDELLKVLEHERAKFKNGFLSSALYIERRLLNVAVTGGSFVDKDNRRTYRRESVKADDEAANAEGVQEGPFFKVKEIIGYLPPWEAFCHEKCGFYQDFYEVRWEFPFSEVDYSRVENGSDTTTGATWEPDENLPFQLDSLRIEAKKDWISKRRAHEQRIASVAKRKAAEKEPDRPALEEPSQKAPKLEVPEKDASVNAPKLARTRRDGKPLIPDMFRLTKGHDFVPPKSDGFASIRCGWPRRPKDYPPGYEVANPPGFCRDSCDCMDDQRPQKSWETHKSWLEDSTRSEMARAAIENLTNQKAMVRKRGVVSKMFYFETITGNLGNMTRQRSALDLAGDIRQAIAQMMKCIPVNALVPGSKVFLPTPALLDDLEDYLPLEFEIITPAPTWLHLEPSSGELFTTEVPSLSCDLPLTIELRSSEGLAGTVKCMILPNAPLGADAVWVRKLTPMVIQRFSNQALCGLDLGVRDIVAGHFQEIYDFNRKQPRAIPLGLWLKVNVRILRLLRASSVGKFTPEVGVLGIP